MPGLTSTPPANALDIHFARLMKRLDPGGPECLEAAAILASNAPSQGHVCVPPEILGETTISQLRTSAVVGAPGEFRPLILDADGRLYLQRYWKYEDELISELLRRLSRKVAPAASLEIAGLPADPTQLLAASRMCSLPVSLVSGGPGTGKTHVAALALLQLCTQAAQEKRQPRFALCAPTGKAAARLKESLEAAISRIQITPEIEALLPRQAVTLHRLLGIQADTGECLYNENKTLPYDVVLVDEASMVDLPLMSKLFAATSIQTRLVLLGDHNQLSSVEAGHVFGDIARALRSTASDAFTELLHNHRSAGSAALVQFAAAMNRGDIQETRVILEAGSTELVRAKLPSSPELEDALEPLVLKYWAPMFSAQSPAEALQIFNRFRILCPMRNGPLGMIAVNQAVEAILRCHGLINTTPFQHGRPVLILNNDYQLSLTNGELGMIWEQNANTYAHFPAPDGLRALSSSRLPAHETAFAMTVHKSQGSEFEHTLLILPKSEAPILTRELIYTAATRARKQLTLWLDDATLESTISRRIVRWSGLEPKLRAGLSD